MSPLVLLFALQLQAGQFDPSKFQPTTFAVFETQQDADVPKGAAGIDTRLTPVMVGGKPSGKSRALPPSHKAFLGKVGAAVGDPTLGGRAAVYTHEVEIVDGKRSYWVATSTDDAEPLSGKRGVAVELAVRHLGSMATASGREHVYLVINFRQRVDTPAAGELKLLSGKSADVRIALPDFAQDLGPGSLGGTYERLGQFTRVEKGKSALHVSVLVDTPPAGLDLKKLEAHVLKSYAKRIGNIDPGVTPFDKPPGFLVEWEEHTSVGRQWNVYFETLAGPRWLEVHFSVTQAQQDDLQWYRGLIGTIVGSIVVTPKP